MPGVSDLCNSGEVLASPLRLAVIFAAVAVLMAAACAMPVTPDASTRPEVGGAGTSVDIGDGRTLFLACAGEGRPTVILEAGLHSSSQAWTESSRSAGDGARCVQRLGEAHQGLSLRPARHGDRRGRVDQAHRSLDAGSQSSDDRSDGSRSRAPRGGRRFVRSVRARRPLHGWLDVDLLRADSFRGCRGLVLVDSFSERMPELFRRPMVGVREGHERGRGLPLENDPASEKFDVRAPPWTWAHARRPRSSATLERCRRPAAVGQVARAS